jgi:hypothetical protein
MGIEKKRKESFANALKTHGIELSLEDPLGLSQESQGHFWNSPMDKDKKLGTLL